MNLDPVNRAVAHCLHKRTPLVTFMGFSAPSSDLLQEGWRIFSEVDVDRYACSRNLIASVTAIHDQANLALLGHLRISEVTLMQVGFDPHLMENLISHIELGLAGSMDSRLARVPRVEIMPATTFVGAEAFLNSSQESIYDVLLNFREIPKQEALTIDEQLAQIVKALHERAQKEKAEHERALQSTLQRFVSLGASEEGVAARRASKASRAHEGEAQKAKIVEVDFSMENQDRQSRIVGL